jgi:hypothetical protein
MAHTPEQQFGDLGTLGRYLEVFNACVTTICRCLSSLSVGQVIVSLLLLRYYFMRETITVAVEDSDVTVRSERVGRDYHDPSVEVVQVLV